MESKDKYVVFEDEDGAKVVVNKEKALAVESDILNRYSIKANRSDDLIEKSEI
jgi:hypothetical protein